MKTESTKIELPEETIRLAKAIKPSFKVDPKTGVTSVEGDPFKENLPEDVTTDMIKRVDETRRGFVNATCLAFGDVVNDVMAKNAGLTQAEASVDMQNGIAFNVVAQKNREFRNPAKAGETTTKALHVSGSIHTVVKTAALKRITAQINDDATERFGKKK